ATAWFIAAGAEHLWDDPRANDFDEALYLCAHSSFAVGHLHEAVSRLRTVPSRSFRDRNTVGYQNWVRARQAAGRKRSYPRGAGERFLLDVGEVVLTTVYPRLNALQRLTMARTDLGPDDLEDDPLAVLPGDYYAGRQSG